MGETTHENVPPINGSSYNHFDHLIKKWREEASTSLHRVSTYAQTFPKHFIPYNNKDEEYSIFSSDNTPRQLTTDPLIGFNTSFKNLELPLLDPTRSDPVRRRGAEAPEAPILEILFRDTPKSFIDAAKAWFSSHIEFRGVTSEDMNLCMEAIKLNWNAIRWVPTNLLNDTMFLLAMSQGPQVLRWIQENGYFTLEFYKKAVLQNKDILKYVDGDLVTYEILKESVTNDWQTIQDLSPSVIDSKLLLIAVKQNWVAIEYGKPDVRTLEICEEAISQSPLALEYIPDDIKTKEMCMGAVTRDWNQLRNVPSKFIDLGMLQDAVSQDPHAYGLIQGRGSPYIGFLQTDVEELLMDAVKRDWTVLGTVPRDMITEELFRVALSQDIRAMEYRPSGVKLEGNSLFVGFDGMLNLASARCDLPMPLNWTQERKNEVVVYTWGGLPTPTFFNSCM
jgi:hypothetical protein